MNVKKKDPDSAFDQRIRVQVPVTNKEVI